MAATDSQDRLAARLKIVDEHIARENQHDLEGILRTFGPTARYDDKPWDGHYIGHEGVRTYYDSLLRAACVLRCSSATQVRMLLSSRSSSLDTI
jgi:uncharacterized protein YciI